MSSFHLVILIVAIALAFDFSNGWHDAANSIATVVSTRVLTPGYAVLWAAFWNFIAAFVFGTAVAKTIGTGMVHLSSVNEEVLIAGLLGAIAWNLFTLILGLPTSSSHALMGGYGGAAIACSGFGAIILFRLDHAHPLHFPGALHRNVRRHSRHHRHQLGRPQTVAVQSGPLVSPPSNLFRGGLQPRPWHE